MIFSDIIILSVSFLGIALIVCGLLFLLNKKDASQDKDEEDNPADVDRNKKHQQIAGRRRRNINPEPAVLENNENELDDENQQINAEDEAQNQEDENEEFVPRTKKDMLKLEKKKAKAENRAFEEAKRDAKKEKELKREEALRERMLEKEAEAVRLKEEEAIRKAEIEKKENEEYAEWKDMISVEEAGTEESDEASKQNLLEDFIAFIKRRKVVVLEDLAMEFGLPAAQCVSRVQSLEELGQLTGVVDDRGKFIYISPEELLEVAKFVKRRGRVSIADLAIESNKLINLKEMVEPLGVDVSEDNHSLDNETP